MAVTDTTPIYSDANDTVTVEVDTVNNITVITQPTQVVYVVNRINPIDSITITETT